MHTSWNKEELAYRAKLAEFGRKRVAAWGEVHFHENTFDKETWEDLNQLGFFGGVDPNSQTSMWKFTAGLEGLASACSDGGFLLTCISTAGFIRALSLFGTDEQKDKFLLRAKRGMLTATAIAESHSGTDTRNLQTIATPNSSGGYVLNGRKWNIAHANDAGASLVLGRMPHLGKRDTTLFLVDHSLPGVSAGPVDSKLGNRTIPTAELILENVPITGENILGEPGQGFRALGGAVLLDRIYYGWMGVQLLRPMLQEAKEFISERTSFGEKLASHQYVQRKITDILVGLDQTEALGRMAFEAMLSGSPEAGRLASATKLTGSKTLVEGAKDLMSLLGSNGYRYDTMSRLMRDALGFMLVGGTEEAHRIGIFNGFMKD